MGSDAASLLPRSEDLFEHAGYEVARIWNVREAVCAQCMREQADASRDLEQASEATHEYQMYAKYSTTTKMRARTSMSITKAEILELECTVSIGVRDCESRLTHQTMTKAASMMRVAPIRTAANMDVICFLNCGVERAYISEESWLLHRRALQLTPMRLRRSTSSNRKCQHCFHKRVPPRMQPTHKPVPTNDTMTPIE